MSDDSQRQAELSDFSGSAALFPLPNGAFFPQVLFPLHIFERRYREMTADALDGDRLIAMALLQPGWEVLSQKILPPIHDIVCLSRITAEEKLPDGRYYLVLQGLARARVVGETETDLPYRIGELELCRDEDEGLRESDAQRIREELLRRIQSLHADLAVNPMFARALDGDLPLGVFCDILAHALGLTPSENQNILAELNIMRRSRIVLEAIHAKAAKNEVSPLHFPPKFSRN